MTTPVGQYIKCGGRKYPLRTPQQVEKARAAMRSARVATSPVLSWNGKTWVTTGDVLR